MFVWKGAGSPFKNSPDKTVMGNYLSRDPPVMKINGILIRWRGFKNIQTYKDALRIVGYDVSDDTPLMTIEKERRDYVFANDKFYIVDGIVHEDNIVYIEKLYGRR